MIASLSVSEAEQMLQLVLSYLKSGHCSGKPHVARKHMGSIQSRMDLFLIGSFNAAPSCCYSGAGFDGSQSLRQSISRYVSECKPVVEVERLVTALAESARH